MGTLLAFVAALALAAIPLAIGWRRQYVKNILR